MLGNNLKRPLSAKAGERRVEAYSVRADGGGAVDGQFLGGGVRSGRRRWDCYRGMCIDFWKN